MLRKTASLLLLVVMLCAFQVTSNPIRKVAALPSTCSVGQVIFLTTGTIGLYQCKVTNIWSLVSSDSVTTAANLAGGSAGQFPYQTGAGATGFRTPNAANGPVVLDASGVATIGTTVIDPTAGIKGPIIACAGTPGSSVGPYGSLCEVRATGVVWRCANAAGCTAAADWKTGGETNLTYGGLTLTNATYPRLTIQNSGASGDVDIYTVPSGRRLLVLLARSFNANGSTSVGYIEVKISGTYYRLTANVSTNTLTPGSFTPSFVAEPGDIIAFNATQANQTFWLNAIEYDSTVTLYSPRITSFVNGNNTVYTVPSGKTATGIAAASISPTSAPSSYFNFTTVSRTVTTYMVQSGGSPSVNNQTQATATVVNLAGLGFITASMAAGDSIVVATDSNSGSQFAWVTVSEK